MLTLEAEVVLGPSRHSPDEAGTIPCHLPICGFRRDLDVEAFWLAKGRRVTAFASELDGAGALLVMNGLRCGIAASVALGPASDPTVLHLTPESARLAWDLANAQTDVLAAA